MRPNENFRKYFPEVDVPESLADSERSSCLKAGTYMVINQVVKNTGLNQKLEDVFGAKAAGMTLDFAAYSIITESNAAQYYPDYAFNHPLFTEDMKIYSDSTLSEFFRSINENQRQGFLDNGMKKEIIENGFMSLMILRIRTAKPEISVWSSTGLLRWMLVSQSLTMPQDMI